MRVGKRTTNEEAKTWSLLCYLLSTTMTAPDFLSTTSTTLPSVIRVPGSRKNVLTGTIQTCSHIILECPDLYTYLRVGVASAAPHTVPHEEPGPS